MTEHPQNDPRHDASPQDIDGDLTNLEQDPAWKLLLKARKPEVSPFFARNVLREVRQLQESRSLGWMRFFTLPRVAFAGAAAVLLAVILVKTGGDPDPALVNNAPVVTPAPEIAAVPDTPAPAVDDTAGFDMGDYQEEIEMIEYLDGLLAVQDVESLDDAALAEILF